MRWIYMVAVIRTPLQAGAGLLAALLVAGCATLPPGVPPAPRDDPAAGVLTLPSGREVAVLPGELEYTGPARFRWPDGRVYDGAWQDGQPHGRGTEQLPDGTVYQGEWHEGERHGEGLLETGDGQHYEGTFVDGMRQGQGTHRSPDGVYRGEWHRDMPHGQGTFEAADGTFYQGGWRHGQRFGQGTYRSPDGSEYDGQWAYDQPHGFGRMENPNGAVYEGEWRDGQRHGYGRSEGPPGLVYEGTWQEGEPHGFGREQRPDGSSYEGDWQNGKRHGQGREQRPDGSFHEGTWELNQALGPGRRQTPSGIEISGMWNDDSVSTGLLALPTGLEFAGPLFSDANNRASSRLVSWLTDAAEHGDPYAQLLLGNLYLDFEQPRPDTDTARRWLGEAARAGIAEAQYRLALTWEGINPPRVVELLSEAAAQGHPGANESLGDYYYGGITVPRNLERAVRYYERAIEGGSVSARNNLAWLLATTDDVSLRDGARAVALIRPIALYTGAWQYLDTLAAAWAAAGDFEQAVVAAEEAIDTARRELAGDDPAELTAMQARLEGYRDGLAYVQTTRAMETP